MNYRGILWLYFVLLYSPLSWGFPILSDEEVCLPSKSASTGYNLSNVLEERAPTLTRVSIVGHAREEVLGILSKLSECPLLEHVDLSVCGLENQDLAAVLNAFSNLAALKHIILDGNQIDIGALLFLEEWIGNHPSIDYVRLAGNKFFAPTGNSKIQVTIINDDPNIFGVGPCIYPALPPMGYTPDIVSGLVSPEKPT